MLYASFFITIYKFVWSFVMNSIHWNIKKIDISNSFLTTVHRKHLLLLAFHHIGGRWTITDCKEKARLNEFYTSFVKKKKWSMVWKNTRSFLVMKFKRCFFSICLRLIAYLKIGADMYHIWTNHKTNYIPKGSQNGRNALSFNHTLIKLDDSCWQIGHCHISMKWRLVENRRRYRHRWRCIRHRIWSRHRRTEWGAVL